MPLCRPVFQMWSRVLNSCAQVFERHKIRTNNPDHCNATYFMSPLDYHRPHDLPVTRVRRAGGCRQILLRNCAALEG